MAKKKVEAEVKGITIKKRCPRCLHEVRADGTCQNPTCKKYVPESGGKK